MLSAIGGTMGLLTGFSIISGVEVREGLTRKKKKSVKFHTWGGGQDKIGSFSHFFYFFSFMS